MKVLLFILALAIFAVGPVLADDCVEVDIELDPILIPGEPYYFYAELTNCSDEAGLIYLTISIDYTVGEFELPEFPVYMGAGQTFSRSVQFVLPPVIPGGEGSICVTARKGEVEATDCVEFTIENPGLGSKSTDLKDRKAEVTNSASEL